MPVQLPSPQIANFPLQSLYRQAYRGLALLLVALLLNVTLLIPSSQAAILNWNPPPNWTGGTAPGSVQVFPTPPDTINGVRVRLTFTGDPIISNIQNATPPPFNLTGGANPTGTLALLIDGATRNDFVTATYRYEDPDGNLVPVENARFVVLDIDTSSGQTAGGQNWNDQVIFRGRNEFAAADVIPTLQSTINPIPNIVAVATPANCPGPLPATQTVPPPAIFPTADSVDTYTPLFTIIGGNPAAHGRQLPANGDSGNPWEARNNCSNGNVVATYPGVITSASFDYGYGPLTTTSDPQQQGIGFYNLFFTPVIIGTAKNVTNVVENADGSFTITYQVLVENYGEIDLRNVNVTENLVNTYTNATSFNVQDVRIVGSTRSNIAAPFTGVANPGFNGSGNDQLIAPGFNNPDGVTLQGRVLNNNNDIVENGGTVTLEFDVRVVPDPADALGFGPFENQVEAEGLSVNTGQRVTDVSTDGTNPDSNGSGSPLDNQVPTVVNLVPTGAAIGVSKGLVAVRLEPGGGFGNDTVRADYEIVVRNTGDEPLENVQLTEELAGVFGAGNFQIVSLTGPIGANTLAVNFPGFTGVAPNDDLLAAGGTLAVGAESAFRLVVDINAASDSLPDQPFENQVAATGTGSNSDQAANDLSNDVGSVPQGQDPITVGQNNNQNTPTPLTFSTEPDVRLVKRITAVIRDGAPIAIAGINTFNDQAEDNNDNQLRQLSNGNLPLGVFTIPFGEVEDGDVLEYSIYFWNNGLQPANNLQLCDEVQNPAQLNITSLLLAPASDFPNLESFGTSADLSDRGAGTPLESSCRSAPGSFPSGGGVVLGGAGFNLPAREVGAVQFRVTLP